MRQILTEEWLQIPDDGKWSRLHWAYYIVKVTIKARVVTVKGSRGTISKDLSHMAVEMQIMKQ